MEEKGVTMSKAKGLRLLVVLLVVPAIAVVAGGASASPPTPVSGTFIYTSSSFDSIRSAGGNTIIELTATVVYTGTFTGTSTVHGKLIAHADGRANFHDVEVFTGTVNGVPGTVTFNLSGSNDSAFNVTATNTIVRATGPLAGLHGVLRMAGTVQIPAGPVGTYGGEIG
jgi:Protein of unknown function (DUF3224)